MTRKMAEEAGERGRVGEVSVNVLPVKLKDRGRQRIRTIAMGVWRVGGEEWAGQFLYISPRTDQRWAQKGRTPNSLEDLGCGLNWTVEFCIGS